MISAVNQRFVRKDWLSGLAWDSGMAQAQPNADPAQTESVVPFTLGTKLFANNSLWGWGFEYLNLQHIYSVTCMLWELNYIGCTLEFEGSSQLLRRSANYCCMWNTLEQKECALVSDNRERIEVGSSWLLCCFLTVQISLKGKQTSAKLS